MRKRFYLLSWTVKHERTFLPNAYVPSSKVVATTDILTEVVVGKMLKRLLQEEDMTADITVLGVSEVAHNYTNYFVDFTNINFDEQ